jgi:beta-phosphoglucomutase-like phosphatase (HAD superfamily)
MQRLAAIIFDFDGVVADCRRGVLLPGAADFVRTAARVVPIGIASGAATREVEDLLDAFAIRRLFTAIVGADQTVRSKPSPDPYLEAVHRLETAGHLVERSRTVAIDDSVWGLVSARSARLRCVGVGRDDRFAELEPHAELVVSGLQALTLDRLDTLVRVGPAP